MQGVKNFRTNPNPHPTTRLEIYARDLLAWEQNGGLQMMQRVTRAKDSKQIALNDVRNSGLRDMMPKYGKFIYSYSNGVLKVVSKYKRTPRSKSGHSVRFDHLYGVVDMYGIMLYYWGMDREPATAAWKPVCS